MNAFALIVVSATLGVDYGWHRGNDGEWEYVIQIEPGLVQTLVNGQALVSQMPPELRGVRRFRIQIGEGEVPREQLPAGGLLARELGPEGAARGAPGGAGWTHSTLPPEPGSWGQRNLDWLRQNPIRLDPLENSFLTNSRGRDFSASPGIPASSPWSSTNPPFQNSGLSHSNSNPLGLPHPPSVNSGFGQGGFGAPSWEQDRMANSQGQSLPGMGPEPPPFDTQRRTGFDTGWGQGSPRVGLPTNPNSSNWGTAWNLPPDPRQADSSRDFALPERPRLDFGNGDDGRRFRLNEDANSAARGLPTGLPNMPNDRSPTVSLSNPDRTRLPNDLPPADYRRTTGTTSGVGGTNANKSRAAHAEITQQGTQRTAASTAAADKIWWPLTTTVLLLFGSIGGNIYLGWLAMDFYRRYRECAWELRTGN